MNARDLWKRRAELLDDLCVCYRLKCNPSGRLLDEIEENKRKLEELK